MNIFYVIWKREFYAYFKGGMGFALLFLYHLFSMLSTFYLGDIFNNVNFNLKSFFYFQPYVFMLLAPALTMRLWSEERKSGTIEFILSQPISLNIIVLAKFCASWSFSIFLLFTTIPLWIYLNAFFSLDNLNILASYLGCILATGLICSVGCMVSSFNNNSVMAYIFSIFVLLIVIGFSFKSLIACLHLDNNLFYKTMSSFNFAHNYHEFCIGQISIDNISYFLSVSFIALLLNVISIEYKRA